LRIRMRFALSILILSLPVALIIISTGCSNKSNTTGKTSTIEDENSVSTSTIHTLESKPGENEMVVTSKAFKNGERIPAEYANKGIDGGNNISIPLEWDNIPEGTGSFALSMIDISANNWVHWMVVNIPSSVKEIPVGASAVAMPSGSEELDNTFGFKGYGGPQPPAGSGDHIYVTTLYALRVNNVKVPEKTSFNEFMRILDGDIIGKAAVEGVFAKR
jgi:Raf kinase inhibitor-like YbhB/YbcL family protein